MRSTLLLCQIAMVVILFILVYHMITDSISDLKNDIKSFDLQQLYTDIVEYRGYDARSLLTFATKLCYIIDTEHQSSVDHVKLSNLLPRLNVLNTSIQHEELKYMVFTLHRVRESVLNPSPSSSTDTLNSMCKHMYM